VNGPVAPHISRWARVSDRLLRWTARVIVAATVVFAIGPAVVIGALSFSNEKFLAFPPAEWGLDQYRSLESSDRWLPAIGTSFRLAFPVAIIAMLISVPAVFAINNPRFRFGRWLELASLGPLLIPITAYAVALYVMFLEFGWLGSFWGLAFAQAAGAVPLTILIAGAAYRRIPRDLEFAAMSLGASRIRAALGITGRLLLPAFAAGFVFALLMSFDDAVYVSFLGGSSTRTLAREILLSLREAVDPVITAISTLLMVFTALLVTLIGWLRNREVS